MGKKDLMIRNHIAKCQQREKEAGEMGIELARIIVKSISYDCTGYGLLPPTNDQWKDMISRSQDILDKLEVK